MENQNQAQQESLMVDDNQPIVKGVIAPAKFTRFKDADWFPKEGKVSVLVGGAGGIGSWLVLFLERARFGCVVYDFDTVEDHNLGGQLFSHKSIGQLKTAALKKEIRELTGEEIMCMGRYEENCLVGSYTFSCFDNMAARKILYANWEKSYGSNPNAIFIDGRLGMEHLEIFCVVGGSENVQKYKKYLFDDSQIPDGPCTLKQTSHTAAMIAGHMMSSFTNHVSNVVTGIPSRDVPFFWQFFIPLNLVTDTPSTLS